MAIIIVIRNLQQYIRQCFTSGGPVTRSNMAAPMFWVGQFVADWLKLSCLRAYSAIIGFDYVGPDPSASEIWLLEDKNYFSSTVVKAWEKDDFSCTCCSASATAFIICLSSFHIRAKSTPAILPCLPFSHWTWRKSCFSSIFIMLRGSQCAISKSSFTFSTNACFGTAEAWD